MTAMNLIVQPAIRSAFLITDTATFIRGRVVSFGPKTIDFYLRGGTFASLACAGVVHVGHFSSFIEEVALADADEFLAKLPTAFRAIERRHQEQGTIESVGHGRMAATVAMFDPKQGASGYFIGNVLNYSGMPGYRVGTLLKVKKSLTEYARDPFPYGTEVTNARHWKPHIHGVRLLEAQRADLSDDHGAPHSVVGGAGVITCVNALGIQRETIVQWPDKIGRRIAVPGALPDNGGIFSRMWEKISHRFGARDA